MPAESFVVNFFGLKLLLEPGLEAHLLNALQVAGPQTECETRKSVDGTLLGRKRCRPLWLSGSRDGFASSRLARQDWGCNRKNDCYDQNAHTPKQHKTRR